MHLPPLEAKGAFIFAGNLQKVSTDGTETPISEPGPEHPDSIIFPHFSQAFGTFPVHFVPISTVSTHFWYILPMCPFQPCAAAAPP
jgi:hypothetical protein